MYFHNHKYIRPIHLSHTVRPNTISSVQTLLDSHRFPVHPASRVLRKMVLLACWSFTDQCPLGSFRVNQWWQWEKNCSLHMCASMLDNVFLFVNLLVVVRNWFWFRVLNFTVIPCWWHLTSMIPHTVTLYSDNGKIHLWKCHDRSWNRTPGVCVEDKWLYH